MSDKSSLSLAIRFTESSCTTYPHEEKGRRLVAMASLTLVCLVHQVTYEVTQGVQMSVMEEKKEKG